MDEPEGTGHPYRAVGKDLQKRPHKGAQPPNIKSPLDGVLRGCKCSLVQPNTEDRRCIKADENASEDD